MRFAILSRNKNLHSIRRLLREAKKAQVHCDVINPLDCQMIVDNERSRILYNGAPLPFYDAILPRIGASITAYGLAVVKQFELLGMVAINGCDSIGNSRDKMTCLQILTQAGHPVPGTVLSRNPRGFRATLEAVGGLPLVLKVLEGTQGVGVMLLNTSISVRSVIDTLHGLEQDVLIQRFISEAAGRDYRAFVIGNRVVAAMMRTAPEGEFRSNIHRGGEGHLVRLPKDYEKAAVQAAKVLGLEIAGVDLIESRSGPLILEVNSSPGFEGIEKATGLNVARLMIQHMKLRAKQNKKALTRARTRYRMQGETARKVHTLLKSHLQNQKSVSRASNHSTSTAKAAAGRSKKRGKS